MIIIRKLLWFFSLMLRMDIYIIQIIKETRKVVSTVEVNDALVVVVVDMEVT